MAICPREFDYMGLADFDEDAHARPHLSEDKEIRAKVTASVSLLSGEEMTR